MCEYYGQLNFVDVTIEKGKKLKNTEDGKIKRRYIAIFNVIDPNKKYDLRCQGSILFKGEKEIANIRTYESDTNSNAFSLDDEAIKEPCSICVVFGTNESIEKIFLVPINAVIDRGISESSISASSLERYEVKKCEYSNIVNKLLNGIMVQLSRQKSEIFIMN